MNKQEIYTWICFGCSILCVGITIVFYYLAKKGLTERKEFIVRFTKQIERISK